MLNHCKISSHIKHINTRKNIQILQSYFTQNQKVDTSRTRKHGRLLETLHRKATHVLPFQFTRHETSAQATPLLGRINH